MIVKEHKCMTENKHVEVESEVENCFVFNSKFSKDESLGESYRVLDNEVEGNDPIEFHKDHCDDVFVHESADEKYQLPAEVRWELSGIKRPNHVSLKEHVNDDIPSLPKVEIPFGVPPVSIKEGIFVSHHFCSCIEEKDKSENEHDVMQQQGVHNVSGKLVTKRKRVLK